MEPYALYATLAVARHGLLAHRHRNRNCTASAKLKVTTDGAMQSIGIYVMAHDFGCAKFVHLHGWAVELMQFDGHKQHLFVCVCVRVPLVSDRKPRARLAPPQRCSRIVAITFRACCPMCVYVSVLLISPRPSRRFGTLGATVSVVCSVLRSVTLIHLLNRKVYTHECHEATCGRSITQ